MTRARPKTDMYLAAVEQAVARPGQWVEIPRRFATELNAKITGTCLQGGYLRVHPREDDVPTLVKGKRYIATKAPVAPRVVADPVGGWKLEIRFDA